MPTEGQEAWTPQWSQIFLDLGGWAGSPGSEKAAAAEEMEAGTVTRA